MSPTASTKRYKRPQIAVAKSIVAEGLTTENKEWLVSAPDLAAHQVHKLWTFSEEEKDQLTAMQRVIETWIQRPGPERPLCIALFGSPGSGKSFAVKQLLKDYEKRVSADKRPTWAKEFRSFTFNLTQIAEPRELSAALFDLMGRLEPQELPVVFFDEFDAPRGARDRGWLSWFLAPMQDGEWIHEGRVQTLRKAIYVFAGGTAHSFEDFHSPEEPTATQPGATTGTARPRTDFEAAKGPDFVSRLRAFLDVKGPDADPGKVLRRALILRHQLEAYNQTWMGAPGFKEKRLSTGLRDWMLQDVKNYKHGARSIGALLDGLTTRHKAGLDGIKWLTMDHRPPEALRRFHVEP